MIHLRLFFILLIFAALNSCRGSHALERSSDALVVTKFSESEEYDLASYNIPNEHFCEAVRTELLEAYPRCKTYPFEPECPEFGLTNWKRLKMKDKQTKVHFSGVTDFEGAALFLYSKTLFSKLNPSLRSSDFAKLRPWQTTIKCASSALNKILHFEGTVYRGFNAAKSLADSLIEGKPYSDKAFMSTSWKKDVALGFVSSRQHGYFFTIKARGGADISAITSIPEEAEVLFPPGSDFIVVKKTAILTGQKVKETNEPIVRFDIDLIQADPDS